MAHEHLTRMSAYSVTAVSTTHYLIMFAAPNLSFINAKDISPLLKILNCQDPKAATGQLLLHQQAITTKDQFCSRKSLEHLRPPSTWPGPSLFNYGFLQLYSSNTTICQALFDIRNIKTFKHQVLSLKTH